MRLNKYTIAMYLNYLCYVAKYSVKKVSTEKVYLRYRLYPRWYSPLYWIWFIVNIIRNFIFQVYYYGLKDWINSCPSYAPGNPKIQSITFGDKKPTKKELNRIVFILTYKIH